MEEGNQLSMCFYHTDGRHYGKSPIFIRSEGTVRTRGQGAFCPAKEMGVFRLARGKRG